MSEPTDRPRRSRVRPGVDKLAPSKRQSKLALGLLVAASPVAIGHAVAAPTPTNSAFTLTNGATTIATTGNTATTIASSGQTATINTTTIHGQTGINSFSDFKVGGDFTVKLNVPDAAKNLVNVVQNKVQIDGIVNSYKNGQIGGDVYFVAPGGFVVGKTGSINVGALTVIAPKDQSFSDNIVQLGNDASASDSDLNTLLGKDTFAGIAVDPSATILISGKINAPFGVSLRANSVTVDATGAVNTGTAATGDAVFAAAVNATGQAAGGAMTTDDKGDVLITASGVADDPQVLDATATATVDIAGKINTTGAANGAITLSADTEVAGKVGDNALAGPLKQLGAGKAFPGSYSALQGAFLRADGSSTVHVESTATLTAQGDVTLAATTKTEAGVSEAAVGADTALVISAVYGEVDSHATAQVDSGAAITTGANAALTVSAANVATLEVGAKSVTKDTGSTSSDAVGIGVADVQATADVAHGATISAGQVNVAARNDDSFKVEASAYALNDAKAGAALAVSDIGAHANATLAADLGTATAAAARGVSVTALNNTYANVTGAESATGNTFGGQIQNIINNPVAAGSAGKTAFSSADGKGDKVKGFAKGVLGGDAGQGDPNTFTLRASGSLALALDDQSAKASLGDASGTPKIYATGDVVVAAKSIDEGIRLGSKSDVASPKPTDATANNPESQGGVSVALGLGFFNEDTEATIAPSAVVKARNIAVDADTETPITNQFLDFLNWDAPSNSFSGVISGLKNELPEVKSHLKSDAGVAKDILTSSVSSSATSSKGSAAGSVSYLDFDNTTHAWVGAGASLTTTSTSPTWSASLAAKSDTLSADWTLNSLSALNVHAFTLSASADVGGPLSTTSAYKVFTAIDPTDSVAVGGAVTNIASESETIAGVDAGATLTSASTLAVKAAAETYHVVLTPTSGAGGAVGLSGMFGRLDVDDHTHAEISNTAQVASPTVELDAHQSDFIVNISADFTKSTSSAVGVAGALNQISADTLALIGDTSADRSLVSARDSWIAVSTPATTGGFVHADTLKVTGENDGQIIAAALAGAGTPNKGSSSPGDVADEDASPTVWQNNPLFQSATGGTTDPADDKVWHSNPLFEDPAGDAEKTKIQSANKDIDAVLDDAEPSSQGKNAFQLSGAGSAAVNISALNVTSKVSGATLDRYSTTGGIATTVSTRNDPLLATAAGGGASVGSGSQTPTAGVAGAITVDDSSGASFASIENSTTITNAGATTVQALMGGVRVAAAIGVALTDPDSGADGGAGAGAFSIVLNKDAASAKISDSTITGSGSASPVSVTAYNATYLGEGGGSGYQGGQAGVGVSFTYADLGDPDGGAGATEAKITNSHLTTVGAVSAQASDSSVLVALAASAGVGANEVGISGSAADVKLHRTTTAEVSGSTVGAAGDVIVSSDGLRQAALDTVLIGQNGPDPSTYAGYNFTTGGVTDSVVTDGSRDKATLATGKGAMVIVAAGAVGVSDKSGASEVGLSFAGAELSNTHQAIIDSSTVDAGSKKLTVKASDDALVVGAAVGVGATSSGPGAGVGSITYLGSSEGVSATVSGASTLTGDTVTLDAHDASTLAGLSGSFAKAQSVAIGASATAVAQKNTVTATATDGAIHAATSLTDQAQQRGLLIDLAFAGGSSQGVTVGGAIATNIVQPTTTASLTGVTVSPTSGTAANTVTVSATDQMAIYTGAIAALFGEDLAAGAAIDTDVISDNGSAQRVKALISGGSVDAKDVTVSASAQGSITAVAAGVSVSSDAAVAGSIVTNADDSTTSASIQNATVTAQNNVGVIAQSTESANVISGAIAFGGEAVGVGIAATTNLMLGTTQAYILGGKIDAQAKDATDTLTVTKGTLTSAPDLGDVTDLTKYVLPDIAVDTAPVTGLAVNASSRNKIGMATLGVGIGAGSVGVAVNAGVNVFGGSTTAYVKSAQINQASADAPGAAQQVDIAASDHSYDANLLVSAAGGENVGAAGAFNVNMFSRSTDAYMNGGALTSAGATRIDAESSQTAVGLTVGGGVGEVGGAAAITVTTFDADTKAYAYNGATLKAASLTIGATNTLGVNINDGVVAVGGVAVGGAFSVVTSKNDTFAGLGRSSASDTDSKTTDNVGTLSIDAERSADYHLHTVGAAGGGTAGVAGMGSILLAKDTTVAGVYESTVHGVADGSDATSIDVTAHENASADLITGALGIGGSGAGIGASVGVIVSSTAVGATVEASETHAADATVTAQSDKNYGSILVSGGVGTAGIGAGVGVVLVGGGQTGGDTSSTPSGSQIYDKAVGTLNAAAGINAPTDQDSHLDAKETASAQGAAPVSTPTSFATIDPSAVSAEINGATVKGGSLTVKATDATGTIQRIGAAGVGGAGAAGGVGYTSVKNAVTASIDPNATIAVFNTTVQATATDGASSSPQANSLTDSTDAWSGKAAEIDTYVGALGGGAFGAGVGVVQLGNTVTAQAGGALTGVGGGALSINASDGASGKTQDYAVAAAGGVAVGAVAGVVTRSGSVTSQILPTTSGADTAVSGYDNVGVTANSTGSATSKGLAAAGGLVAAGSAVYTLAKDTTGVTATLGKATYDVGVSTAANAIYAPDVDSEATGVAISGYGSLGAAIADAQASGTVTANVADNAKFTGASNLSVEAQMTRTDSDASAYASTIAGAGALLVGGNATVSTATTNANVNAYIGKSVALGSGDVLIDAGRDSLTSAAATGVAVGGLLAVGFNQSTANVGGQISAYLDSGFTNSNTALPNASVGKLTIRAGSGADTSARDGGTLGGAAPGSDMTKASVTAGAGGAFDGVAAQASSDNTTNLYAGIQGNGAVQHIGASDGAAIVVDYVTQADGSADTLQASIAGRSGASLKRIVEDTLKTEIGAQVGLASTGDLTVKTAQITGGTGGVTAAGGGVFNGAAAEDLFSIKPKGEADVDAGATLAVLGDPASSPGDLRVQAENIVGGSAQSKLTAGGLFQGGSSSAVVDTTELANTTTIGAGAQLASVGQLAIGAFSLENITATTEMSVGSFAGVAEGHARATAATIDTVNIGAKAVLQSYGDLSVTAGRSGDGFYDTSLNATANTDVYNESVIPAHTKPDATAENNNNAYLNIASGAQLLGVRDVNLTAYDPAPEVHADGTGHIPYTDAVGASIDGSTNNTSSTATITMAGTAKAGILAKQEVDLSVDGVLTFGATTDHSLASLGANDLGTKIQRQIDTLTAQQSDSGLTPDQQDSIGAQIDALNLLLKNLPAGQVVSTLNVGNLFAAAGDVNVQAKSFVNNGATLSAAGGPTITVNSDSADYQVLVGSATIPVESTNGGHVTFTGGASRPTTGVTETDPGGAAVINIASTADSGHADVLLGGDISNYGGQVKILSQNGDLGQLAGLYAQQLDISVPNGAYVVPNSATFYAGGTPESLFESYQLLSTSPSGSQLAQAAASALFRDDYVNNHSDISFQTYLLAGYAWSQYAGTPRNGDSSGNAPTALTFTDFFSDPGHGDYRLDGAGYSGTNYNFTTISATQNRNTSNLPAPSGGSKIYATSIIVNANLIDIDSSVTAGHSNDWSLSLANNSALTNLLKSWDQLYASGEMSGAVRKIDPTTTAGITTSATGSQLIGLQYDVANKKLLLNDVDASGGGFVYLTGNIGNTSYDQTGQSPIGTIKINNGYGQVAVTNSTGVALQVNNVNVGQGDLGVVRITDFQTNDANQRPLTTWYVDKVGQGLTVYNNNNDRSVMSLATAQVSSSSSGDVGSYTPVDNLRYNWDQSWDASRTLTYDPNGNYYNNTQTSWVGTSATNGTPYYTTSNTSSDIFQTSLSSATLHYVDDTINVSCGCRGTFNGATIVNIPVEYVDGVHVTESSSVKANNPIGINFSGNASGSITVGSNANVYIHGALTNPNGTTTVTATNGGSILDAGGKIDANIITLSGATIGAADKPIALVTPSTPNANTAISASATGGVSLAVSGQANLQAISATAGDVQITASNGIAAAANATAIVGDNVALATTAGAIGSKDAPITIAASVTGPGRAAVITTAASDGSAGSSQPTVLHGVLTALADGDIAVSKTSGDLQVAKVQSTAGDVYLTAQDGNIVNALTTYTVDKATQDRLAATWSDLHLTDHKAASDAIVQPFEKLIVADYTQYWSIRRNATVTGDTVSLTPAQAQAFAPQAAAALNVASPTDDQIRSYVQSQYDAITTFVASKLGSTSAAGFDTYSPTYSYTLDPTSTLYASLTAGAGTWTTAQLSTEINVNALVPVTDTQVLKQAPNILGRNVTLTANNDVGVDLTPTTVVLTPGTKANDADLATLAAAGPGDIEKVTTDAKTGVVTVVVDRRHMVGVDAQGVVTASAGGNLYLGGPGDAAIASLTAGGTARLFFGQDITDAATGDAAIQAHDLTLEAGTGDIGAAAKPLTIDVAGALNSVRGGNVYVEAVKGDLNIGVAYAPGAMQLTSKDGSILSSLPESNLGGADDVRIQAGSLDLVAKGDIGADGSRLQVNVTDGRLTAKGDGLDIYSPLDLTLGRLDLKGEAQIEGGGAVTLADKAASAGFSLATAGVVSFSRNAQLNSDGDVEISGSSLSLADDASITAKGAGGQAGDLSLASKQGDMTIGVLHGVDLTANGAVTLKSAAALSVNGTIKAASLDAGASDAILVDDNAGVTTTGAASFNADSIEFGARTKLQTTAGSVSLKAKHGLALDDGAAIASGGTLDAHAGSITLGDNDKVTSVRDGTFSVDGVFAIGDSTQLAAGSAKAPQAAQLQIKAGAFSAGQKLTASATGELDVSATGKAANGQASGVTLGDSASFKGADVQLASSMGFTVGEVFRAEAVTGDLAITSTGALSLGGSANLKSDAGSVKVKAGGLNAGASLSVAAARNLTLATQSADLAIGDGSALSGAVISLNSVGGLTIGPNGRVTAAKGLAVTATGALAIGATDSLDAGADALTLTANALSLGDGDVLKSTRAVTVAVKKAATVGDAVSVTAASADVRAGAITAGDDLSVATAGAAKFATTTGDLDLGARASLSGDTVSLNSAAGMTAGATAHLTTANGLTLAVVGDAAFAQDAILTGGAGSTMVTAGALTLGDRDALAAGRTLSVAVDRTLKAGDGLALRSGSLDVKAGATALGDDLSALTAGALKLTTTTADLALGGRATLSGSTVALNSAGALSTGGSARIAAQSGLTVASLAGTTLGAASSLDAGSGSATLTASALTLGDKTALSAGRTARIAVQGALTAGDAVAVKAAVADVKAGSIATGDDLSVATTGALGLASTAGDLTLGDRATLSGDTVALKSAGALTAGAAAKLSGAHGVTVTSVGGMTFGAASSLNAGAGSATLTAAAVTLGDKAALTAGQTATVAVQGAVTAGSGVFVTAAVVDLEAGSIAAGDDLSVTTTGALKLASTAGDLALGDRATLSGDTVALNSAGALTTGSGLKAKGASGLVTASASATTLGPAAVLGGGAGSASLSGSSLTLGPGGSVSAAGSLDLIATRGDVMLGDQTTLQAATATVQASGHVDTGAALIARTSGDMAVGGQAVTIGDGSTVSADGLLTVATTTGNLTFGQDDVLVGKGVTLFATGGLYAGPGLRAIADGALSIGSYGEAILGSGAVLQSLGGDASVVAGTNLTIGSGLQGAAAGALSIAARSGDLTLGDASALSAGGVNLAAGRTLVVGPGAAWNAGQDLTVAAGADARFGPGAALTAGRDVALDAGGDAALTGAVSAVGVLRLDISGALAWNAAGAAGSAVGHAGSLAMGGGSSLHTQGALQLGTDRDMTLGRLQSDLATGEAIALTSGGRIAANGDAAANLTVGSNAATTRLVAQGDIGAPAQPIVVDLARLQASSANGGVWIRGLRSLADVGVDAANGPVAMQVEGALAFGTITAASLDLDASGAIDGTSAKIGAGSIRSQSAVDVQSIETGGPLVLGAPSITAAVVNTGPGPLPVSATGYDPTTNTGLLDLTVDSKAGLTFPKLYVDNGQVTTTATSVQIADGKLGQKLSLVTPAMKMLLTRTFVRIDGVDLELVARNGAYKLSAVDRQVSGSAAPFQPDGDGVSIDVTTGVLLNRPTGIHEPFVPPTATPSDPVTVSDDISLPDTPTQIEVVVGEGDASK